jgi:hypothetical protein
VGEPEPIEVLSREGRRPWPRAVVAGGLGVLLVVGLLVVVVDGGVRSREDRALDGCASGLQEAFAQAVAPLDAMASYVRPVLENGPTPDLRRGMYGLVSEAAEGSESRLTEVARKCREIDVWWVHPALRARRDACLRGLDERTAFLRRVARDGHEAFRGERPTFPAC